MQQRTFFAVALLIFGTANELAAGQTDTAEDCQDVEFVSTMGSNIILLEYSLKISIDDRRTTAWAENYARICWTADGYSKLLVPSNIFNQAIDRLEISRRL